MSGPAVSDDIYEEEKPLRWGTIIPLIGGSALGCKESTGVLPLFHLSYGAFAKNDSHIRRYVLVQSQVILELNFFRTLKVF